MRILACWVIGGNAFPKPLRSGLAKLDVANIGLRKRSTAIFRACARRVEPASCELAGSLFCPEFSLLPVLTYLCPTMIETYVGHISCHIVIQDRMRGILPAHCSQSPRLAAMCLVEEERLS